MYIILFIAHKELLSLASYIIVHLYDCSRISLARISLTLALYIVVFKLLGLLRGSSLFFL